MTLKKEDIFDGLIIAGPPAEINRAISEILNAGFLFEPHYDPTYVGDAIIVVAPGSAPASIPAPAPEPEPAAAVETKADEVAEEATATIEAEAEAVETAVDVAVEVAEEVKPARRGRKPSTPKTEEPPQEG